MTGTLKDFLDKKKKANEEDIYFSKALRMLKKVSEKDGVSVFEDLNSTKLADLGAIFIKQAGLDIEQYLKDHENELDEWSISLEGCGSKFIEESEARNFSIKSIQPGKKFTFDDLKNLAKEMILYCENLAQKDYQEVIDSGNDDEWCIGYDCVPGVIKKDFLFA